MFYFIKQYWLLFSILVVIIGLVVTAYLADFSRPMDWGVTFSAPYAEQELGLDSRAAYLAVLDDLKVSRLRLSAYWNEVEAVEGDYDFTELDWQVEEAAKRGVRITLAVGRRLPRWPECHDPLWVADRNSLEVDQKQLEFVKAVAKRYVGNKQIVYWQVENEPYLGSFGICPAVNEPLLKQEIAAVREIVNKEILVTDSGELSTWWPVSHSGGDILGTTLYRTVYNDYIGYFHWFTPPSFYWVRVRLLEKFTPIKRVIVAELQGEAWHRAGENLAMLSQKDADLSMSLKQFKENISFTRRAGFDEAYLWGVEWWYLMKEKGNPAYWDEAKKLWGSK